MLRTADKCLYVMFDMNRSIRIISVVVIATVAFGIAFVVLMLASLFILQGHKHPDNWTTTIYDKIIMVSVLIAYVYMLAKKIRCIVKDE